MLQTLRKYGVTLDDSTAGSRKISFLPYKAGTNTFATSSDWTPAAADFKVAKAVTGSGLGSEASIGTAPTWVNRRVVIILSNSELTCRYLTIRIENAAINSDEILVETFGHASAQYPTIYSSGGAGNMLSAGTGTDQIDVDGTGAVTANVTKFAGVSGSFTSGIPDVNVAQFGGVAGTFSGGTPEVNVTQFAGTPSGSLVDGVSDGLQALGYSSARSALLDNLDGVATLGSIDGVLNAIAALNNLSALANLYGSPLLEIPDSSSTLFAYTLVVRDNEGKLVNLDANPTITAANAAGTSRTANLSAVSHPATGRYTFTYSVSSTAAEESLRITCSGTVSGEGRYVEWIGAVVNYDTLTTLAAVKAKTDNLPSDPASTTNVTAVYNRLGAPAGASVSADIAAVAANAAMAVTQATTGATSATTAATQATSANTAAAAAKVVTDKLATMLTSSGGNSTYTVDALKNAPTGGSTAPTAEENAAATVAALAGSLGVDALNPTDADGNTIIVAGDDYTNDSLQDRRLTYTITGYTGVITGASVKWKAVRRSHYDRDSDASAELTITSGTASLTGGVLTLKVPVTAVQSAAFKSQVINTANANYKIQVALVAGGGEVLTQVLGDGFVLKPIG